MLSMKKHIGFIAMALIVMIDLWTKHLVASNLRLYEAIEIIPNFFWITYVLNTGAAWSMFNNFTWLLTLISAVATVGLSYVYWTKKHNVLVSLGLVLMIAGTFGNLVDRFFYGAVRDFLSFNILGYMWPVFNVADMSLVIGVGFILLDMVVNPHES